LFLFSFFYVTIRAVLSGLPLTSRRLGEVAFLKLSSVMFFISAEVSAETSAISPNR
jgi:hypothetical protein